MPTPAGGHGAPPAPLPVVVAGAGVVDGPQPGPGLPRPRAAAAVARGSTCPAASIPCGHDRCIDAFATQAARGQGLRRNLRRECSGPRGPAGRAPGQGPQARPREPRGRGRAARREPGEDGRADRAEPAPDGAAVDGRLRHRLQRDRGRGLRVRSGTPLDAHHGRPDVLRPPGDGQGRADVRAAAGPHPAQAQRGDRRGGRERHPPLRARGRQRAERDQGCRRRGLLHRLQADRLRRQGRRPTARSSPWR